MCCSSLLPQVAKLPYFAFNIYCIIHSTSKTMWPWQVLRWLWSMPLIFPSICSFQEIRLYLCGVQGTLSIKEGTTPKWGQNVWWVMALTSKLQDTEWKIQKREKEEHTLYWSTCLGQGKILWVKAVGSESKALVWEDAAHIARADKVVFVFFHKYLCRLHGLASRFACQQGGSSWKDFSSMRFCLTFFLLL